MALVYGLVLRAPRPVDTGVPPAMRVVVAESSRATPDAVGAASIAPSAASAPASTAPAHADSGARDTRPVTSKAPEPRSSVARGKININAASKAELELLPGIGPALAQRIIDHRDSKGRLRGPADLDQVRGIGPKLLEKIGPLVVYD